VKIQNNNYKSQTVVV